MKYVQKLSEGHSNPNLLGGKGSNLVKLIKAGIHVPPGFIININAYKKFLRESYDSKKLEETMLLPLDPKTVLRASKMIQLIILKSEIPKDIVDEIRVALEQNNKGKEEGIYFAVRSSATVEDSSNFSFAGQADSFLYNKTLDEVLTSLKQCWMSLFSPRALLYILQMRKKSFDISLLDVQMAVIVQKMVNSQISGVLFTANVVTNDQTQMYLNSTWGLGETIADNSIIPDTIIINKDNFEIIKKIIGEKEKKAIQNPKGSGTIIVENDSKSREKCSLNEDQLRRLYKLALKVENTFQYPQDIEWAIENEVIYTLQTRPITTLR